MTKALFTTFVLTLAFQSLLAQRPQANTHITNNYINKFAGLWRWVSGNDTVDIKIAKIQFQYDRPPAASADRLVGCHRYVKNGVLVESSMDKFDSVATNFHWKNTLFAWNMDDMDTAKAEGLFKDISKHKKGALFLDYVDMATPQLVWKLENTAGLAAVPDGSSFDYGFTLPRNMILVKQ
jgi:hypothetical protein